MKSDAVVFLDWDNWDDYGYKTSFEATVFTAKLRLRLGMVKILAEEQDHGITEIPERFRLLPSTYCSLGQSIEYYEGLAELPEDIARRYLRCVRDAVAHPDVRERFEDLEGWRRSLTRYGQAEFALANGYATLYGGDERDGPLSFRLRRDTDYGPFVVPFFFDPADDLPGRSNALIGYNGVGKTKLLGDLAVAASRVGNRPQAGDEANLRLQGNNTVFGSVIAISYSAFDNFVLPRQSGSSQSTTEQFGYVYCGLRRPLTSEDSEDEELGTGERSYELKSEDELDEEVVEALKLAKRRDADQITAALDILAIEPSFGLAGVEPRSLGAAPSRALGRFKKLSTGHKIVINIIAQLAAHLSQRSLVLIDEPESHLHPPLLAALLKSVQHLLDSNDSFAVIATHSPVVLQETPSKYVQVIERIGDEASVRRVDIETFGESVGAITRHVFSLDSSSTDFQAVLRRLAQERNIAEIESLFALGLSRQARALVLRYQREG